ncbi:MAG TPA: biopolymer transporter ExbD [Fibrobacteria bacterium]|nr:biopolymer transporter ExbD [Fibrobacteria bacterium]
MEPFLIQTKKRGGFELNVVPLIDVVFVLLIFTILTSSLTKETGVTVDKPQAQSAGELNRQSILVAITREGTVHVNERQVDLESLQDVLRRMLTENALGEVVLISDRESNTGLLVAVMDACNLAGAKKISIAAMSK